MMYAHGNTVRWRATMENLAELRVDAVSRERACNWLAFGLLLAAWNFCDNDAVRTHAERPAPLDNHALVTARAARDLQL